MQRPRPAVLAAFVLVSIALRLVPWVLGLSDPQTTVYPWNFSPFYAICLFGAAYMVRRRDVFLLMLGAWLVGDVGIGLVTGNPEFAFYRQQAAVYAGYALLICTGFLLRSNRSWPAVAGTGLLGAVVFYVVSNFGVWALGNGTLYPHTLSGLGECYVAAIPYFRHTLISMAIFLPLLFNRFSLTVSAPETSRSLATQSG